MKLNFFGVTACVVTLLMSSCSESTDKSENQDATDTTLTTLNEESTTCDCESTWFNGTSIVAPDEGPSSPFAAASTTNCLFHQWAWQKFLYITQVPSSATAPYFISSMDQVNSNMDPVIDESGLMVLSENAQAGGGGILASNETYNGSTDVVYYSIHISDQFNTDADAFRTMIMNDSSTVNNRETFSVGALELKVSWVNSSTLKSSDLANYYRTDAMINGVTTNVALLGMHVVGVVENHPEFIWATFEHYDLAAYYDWENTSSKDVLVTSENNLPLFNSSENAGLTDISWVYGDKTPRNPNNVFAINKYGTPRVAGGGFMDNTSQADGAKNYNNIDELNQSVMDSLTKKGSTENLLWANYFYNGALWMNFDGLSREQQIDSILAHSASFGNANAGKLLRGSVNTYNVTMETYEQTKSVQSIHAMTVDSLMNCFDCHGPSSYLEIAGVSGAQSPIYLSHIFMNQMHEVDATLTLDQVKSLRFSLFNKYRKQ